MRTILCGMILVLALGALAGCSVFGIATKGELERQDAEFTDRLADQSAALDGRLAAVGGRLEAMDRELGAAIADLADENRATAVAVAEVRTRFEGIQGQLQLALADLESVAAAAERAEAGSRQAMQVHRDVLQAERARLQDRLRELDYQLAALPGATPPVTVTELPAPLVPEAVARGPASAGGLPRPGLRLPDKSH
ncbi:hypothetical protein KDM41_00605 [bacterium]|nr:hypothetical protein [bacterium]